MPVDVAEAVRRRRNADGSGTVALPAEISFYHALRQAVGERVTACAKVRLADVFFVARPDENAAARNRIAAKHVDFLLCDPATMRPLAGIEMDDAGHTRAHTGRETNSGSRQRDTATFFNQAEPFCTP